MTNVKTEKPGPRKEATIRKFLQLAFLRGFVPSCLTSAVRLLAGSKAEIKHEGTKTRSDSSGRGQNWLVATIYTFGPISSIFITYSVLTMGWVTADTAISDVVSPHNPFFKF